jgi:hypothetical protein
VLGGLTFARCYIDDIVVWSASLKEHLLHLQEIFSRLRKAGLKVHPGKCLFAAESIDFLGHRVSAAGLAPQEEKVAAVRNLPAPTDVSGVRGALGLFSYYRKFVPHFSSIANPLNQLLRKGVQWRWGPEQEKAFQTLKDCLCSAGVLRQADFTKPFYLATDWSQKGMGAVLGQKDERGAEYAVCYASRSCNKAEANYSSFEGECLAVI